MPTLRTIAIAAVLIVGVNSLPAQSLRGSRASVDRMYSRAVRTELDFLRTSKGIYEAVKDGELVMINITMDVMLEDVGYPFVLPKTRDVLNTLAARYRATCGERLVVTSAARPRGDQPRNASPKSVHPTGMAIDFRRPTGVCLTWLRSELVRLERAGVLEATEERRPPHFHVAVLQRGSFAPIAPAVATATDRAPGMAPAPATAPTISATSGGTVVLGDSVRNGQKPVAKPAAVSSAKAMSPSSYTVRRGDTISEIAKRFGVSEARLRSLNGLRSSTIRVGQRLRLK